MMDTDKIKSQVTSHKSQVYYTKQKTSINLTLPPKMATSFIFCAVGRVRNLNP